MLSDIFIIGIYFLTAVLMIAAVMKSKQGKFPFGWFAAAIIMAVLANAGAMVQVRARAVLDAAFKDEFSGAAQWVQVAEQELRGESDAVIQEAAGQQQLEIREAGPGITESGYVKLSKDLMKACRYEVTEAERAGKGVLMTQPQRETLQELEYEPSEKSRFLKGSDASGRYDSIREGNHREGGFSRISNAGGTEGPETSAENNRYYSETGRYSLILPEGFTKSSYSGSAMGLESFGGTSYDNFNVIIVEDSGISMVTLSGNSEYLMDEMEKQYMDFGLSEDSFKREGFFTSEDNNRAWVGISLMFGELEVRQCVTCDEEGRLITITFTAMDPADQQTVLNSFEA